MNPFLRRHKLIDSTSIILNCDIATFFKKFRENVEFSDLKFNPFQPYLSGSKLYKGTSSGSSFKITKTQQLFQNKKQSAIGNGKVTQVMNGIKVDLEINGINPFMKFFFKMFILFEVIIFLGIVFFSNDDFSANFIILPIFLFHTIIFISMFYFLTRKLVKNFKQEIEQEFLVWIQ